MLVGEVSGAEVVDPLIGKVLNGRFTVLGAIGSGGMGRVYKAIQMPLDRIVALKILNRHFATDRDPGFRQRFELEASMTSKLKHPNTIVIIDYGVTDDGVYYIAMEYVEGLTLSELVTKDGPLPWARALHIAQQMCRSLREAHRMGIVHRDMKPANVMIIADSTDEDLVKVLDFGLVKSFLPDSPGQSNVELTQRGMLIGSPQYMAPEQARNHSDPRSDVYSMGVTLYQALVGRPPFQAKESIDVILKHFSEPPPRLRSVRPDLDIPGEVEALVLKCLEKNPANRYQSMDEVLQAIRRAGVSTGRSGMYSGTRLPPPALEERMQPQQTDSDNPTHANTVAVRANTEPIELSVADFMPTGSEATSAGKAFWITAFSLVGLLVLGGVAYMVKESSRPASVVAAPQAPEHVEPTSAMGKRAAPRDDVRVESAEPKRNLPAPIRFKIGSMPPGASVTYNGKRIGRTPVNLDVPPDSSGAASAEVTLSLDGYHTQTFSAEGFGPEVALKYRLQSSRAHKPTAASASAPARASLAPAAQKAAEPASSAPERAAPREPESSPAAAPAPVSRAPRADAPPEQAEGERANAQPGLASSALAAPELPKLVGNDPVPFNSDAGMSRPVQIAGRPPAYSREALAAKVQGLLLAKCVITARGTVEKCRVIKPLAHMDKAVLDALATHQYKPVTHHGRPISVEYVFYFRFMLPNR